MKLLIVVLLVQSSQVWSQNEIRGCGLSSLAGAEEVLMKAPTELCTHVFYEDYGNEKLDEKILPEVCNLKTKHPKMKVFIGYHAYLDDKTDRAQKDLEKLMAKYDINGVLFKIELQPENETTLYMKELCSLVHKEGLECFLSTAQFGGPPLNSIDFTGLDLESYVDGVVIKTKIQSVNFKHIPKPQAVLKSHDEDFRSLEEDIQFWKKQGFTSDKLVAIVNINPIVIYHKAAKKASHKGESKGKYTFVDVYYSSSENGIRYYSKGTGDGESRKLGKNFVVGDNSIIVNGKEGYVYAEDEAQLITKSFSEAVRMQTIYMKTMGLRGFLVENLNEDMHKDPFTNTRFSVFMAAVEGFDLYKWANNI